MYTGIPLCHRKLATENDFCKKVNGLKGVERARRLQWGLEGTLHRGVGVLVVVFLCSTWIQYMTLYPWQVSDVTLLEKLNKSCSNHAHFESRASKKFLSDLSLPHDCFRLRHYAGNVSMAALRLNDSTIPDNPLQGHKGNISHSIKSFRELQSVKEFIESVVFTMVFTRDFFM